ncbi:MAG: hypothetical protein QG639_1133 [Patescibacteria group bacterium]|nr:hypothetical protein [Patescibacteria group bacterium]
MRSLLGLFFWSLFVIPATIGGVIAVNQAFPELLGKASQQNEPSSSVLPLALQSDISADVESTSLPAETQDITYTTVNNYTTNTTTNPITEKTVEFDLDDITEHRLLYIDDDELEVFGQGSDGQVLQATGDGLPEWIDLGIISADWASPGAIGGTSPNTGIFTQATLSGNSVPLIVGSTSDFQVLDEGRLEISYDGDSGYLSSSGGAIFINNTDNIGTGLGIYSDAAGEAFGNMINVKVDNPLYNQAAFYMNYDGLSNAVEIVSNSSDSSSNALAVTGNNINDSTLGIIGYELAKGTIKISHYRPGSGNDSSASALSIDLKGVGTRAQGVYVDSTESGGTLGNLLRLRNESIDKFVVNYQGNLTTVGNITQGANGSDTTFTKYGNVVGDEFFIGTNGAGRFQRSASNSEVFRAQIAGDANGRWVGTSDGRMRWGDGTNATDVTLRRIGTARLGVEGAITLNNLNADADTVIKGVNDSNLLYVDASADNIGIGTSSPIVKLDLRGGSIAATGTNTAFALGDSLVAGNYGYLTWDSASDLLILSTQADTATMVLNEAGNVGIGTTIPGGKLHVFGGDILLENNQAYRIKDSGGSARSVLAYTSGNNVQLYNYASTGIVQIGINNASNTGGIRFFTNNNVEQVRIDPAGLGVGATTFGTGADNVLAIASSTAPSTSITDGIQLFAVDQGGLGHELRVRDEVGNVTTISPHNFSVLPDGISEPMAWTYYSERDGKAISADMTKALRLVEHLSGVELVYVKDLETGEYLETEKSLDNTSINKSNLDWKAELEKYVSVESLATTVQWDDAVWQFLSSVVFKARATFEKTTVFLADIQIFGKVKVGKDTAGTVTIPVGATSVTVTFSSPYQATPLVYVTPVGEAFEEYSISQISEAAFTINLENPSSNEVRFNWLAVVGDGGEGKVEAHYPTPTPKSESEQGEVAGESTEAAEVEELDQEASQSAEASSSATIDIL